MYATIDDARRQHRGHWFDPSSMRFFDSRTSQDAIRDADGAYWFVSSERFHGSEDYYGSPRLYTIRRVIPSGDIETVGDFQQYSSSAAAWRALRRDLGIAPGQWGTL